MMSFFLHTYYPQPFFHLGSIRIYWYGLFLFLGIIIGLFCILRFSKKYNIQKEEIFSLTGWIFIFSLVGARIYYLILNWSYYQKNFSEIYKIWHGGLSFHGALVFGFLAVFLWTRKNKKNLSSRNLIYSNSDSPQPSVERLDQIATEPRRPSLFIKRGCPKGDSARAKRAPIWFLFLDLFVPGLVLSQIIGRWGNYFNQELFGRPTRFFLGIPIDLDKRPLEFLERAYFHPIFLYESLYLFLFFIILLLWKKRFKNGQIFFFYLIFWSFGRFFLEFLRVDFQPIIFGLRLAQIVSIAFFLIGINYFWLFAKAKAQI